MKAKNSDWYKYGWSLDIKNQSWVEDTENQVNFIIKALGLKGKVRILDLACGYGRHSLMFAQKGFSVVGVDITKDHIDDAIKTANDNSLTAEFIHPFNRLECLVSFQAYSFISTVAPEINTTVNISS
jgi:tRNA/tmRNA/rRNA uracil-C5-methylase (TrmA/RlmC/RlmD family)